MNGPHEHRCGICNKRFECFQITHCHKVSDDPDPLTRPVCYKDECRVAQDQVIKALKQLGEKRDG